MIKDFRSLHGIFDAWQWSMECEKIIYKRCVATYGLEIKEVYDAESLLNSSRLVHFRKLLKQKLTFIFIFTRPFCVSKGLKAFKVFIKPFLGTTKNCENKHLSSFSLLVRDPDGKG